MAIFEELIQNMKQQDLDRFKMKLDSMEDDREQKHLKDETEGINKIMERRIQAMTPEPPSLTDMNLEESEKVQVTHGRPMPKKDVPEDAVKLKPPTETVDTGSDLFTRFLETIKGN